LERTEAGILEDAVQRALRRRERGLSEDEEDEEDELGIDSEEARYAKVCEEFYSRFSYD
jgi:hypothetical protein